MLGEPESNELGLSQRGQQRGLISPDCGAVQLSCSHLLPLEGKEEAQAMMHVCIIHPGVSQSRPPESKAKRGRRARMKALAVLLALAGLVAVALAAQELSAEQEALRREVLEEMRAAHPPRQPRRRVEGMHNVLSEKARLLFRSMDR